MIREIHTQFSPSPEDLARQLGVSYATVNRWENGLSKPSKLARAQFVGFYKKMIERDKLSLSDDLINSTGLKQDQGLI